MTLGAAGQAAEGQEDGGIEAALGALRYNWDEAYRIGFDGSHWWYERRDDIGGRQHADTPDDLRQMIWDDYMLMPVPKELP